MSPKDSTFSSNTDFNHPEGDPFLFQAVMEIVAQKGWSAFEFEDLEGSYPISVAEVRRFFPHKSDLLTKFIEEITERVFDSLKFTTSETPQEKLFDLFMIRFDLLTPYKPAMGRIYHEVWQTPLDYKTFLGDMWKTFERVYDSLEVSDFFLCRDLGIIGLTGLYARVFPVWLEDRTLDQGKTMAFLEEALTRLFQFPFLFP